MIHEIYVDFAKRCDTDLEEGIGIAQAFITDELGVSCKAIAPVGANAALSSTLQEEEHIWRHLMNLVHGQQEQICQTWTAIQKPSVAIAEQASNDSLIVRNSCLATLVLSSPAIKLALPKLSSSQYCTDKN